MEVDLVNFEECPNWQVAAASHVAGLPLPLGRGRDATAPVAYRAARDPDNAGRLGSRASPVILVTGRLRLACTRDRVRLAFGRCGRAGSGCDSRMVGQIQAGMADAA